MWNIAKSTGRPLHKNLENVWNWPYTITQAVMLRQKYDSYQELSEPIPEEWWDYPHLVRRHIEKLYPSKKKTSGEINVMDIED